MRVLHLFGDWKWTGPAEPTLDLCQELRALGVQADLACMEAPPDAQGSLPERARARGIVPLHVAGLRRSLFSAIADIPRVAAALKGYDLLHVHFSHDHFVGGRAARKVGGVKVVRTNHKGVPLDGLGAGYLLKRLTDRYVSYVREPRAVLIDPAMRLERFAPRDVPRQGFTVGVVARM